MNAWVGCQHQGLIPGQYKVAQNIQVQICSTSGTNGWSRPSMGMTWILSDLKLKENGCNQRTWLRTENLTGVVRRNGLMWFRHIEQKGWCLAQVVGPCVTGRDTQIKAWSQDSTKLLNQWHIIRTSRPFMEITWILSDLKPKDVC